LYFIHQAPPADGSIQQLWNREFSSNIYIHISPFEGNRQAEKPPGVMQACGFQAGGWAPGAPDRSRSARSKRERVPLCSAESEAHQDRIFNRISVVAQPATRFAEAQGTVESERCPVRGADFERQLARALLSELTGQSKEKLAPQAAPLAGGRHGNSFELCLRGQKAGNGKAEERARRCIGCGRDN